jgi:hypothetical protein
MTHLERRLIEAQCLAALCTAEALLPQSGVSPGAARALAKAHRARARRLEEVIRGKDA